MGFFALGVLVGWVFFVIFGRTTVRRLSRTADIRKRMGIELISGWRIFNVAEALVLPVSLFDKLHAGSLSAFWADARVLRQHATRYDIVMAHLFFWTFVPSTTLMIVLALLDSFGILPNSH
ncbi:hypothetical protein F3N43_13245 [Alkalilimnicola sp. S0819]|uniref:hypothetical protein n=1 Tax=Alkalilimnicola sp. S0819 TaxID=2613922 RepID=UPI0012621891|nr:hypothetical protein [Alkalilimnicola sp. S0819]KAB7619597.1 hypothetical protein F3N43_13245 [Alkalilimnicola sp. S0819]MPQ17600.1 hypothetical protein [Alkalilimnicola sp. S0819]